jgi:hypothetical protein
VSKQGTAGKQKLVTFVIPQKLETVRRLQIGENQREITILCIIGLSAICDNKEKEEQLQYSIKCKCEGPFQMADIEESKLVQLDKVLYK